MNIIVNGQKQTIQPCTLAEMVSEQGLDKAALVVELNGNIIKEIKWSSVYLQEGDRLELLRFVGGG